jgi:hypothetical protein
MKQPRFAPFAAPTIRPPAVPEGAADPPAEDDLPPIEQFLDEYPSIEDYLAEEPEEIPQVPVAVGTPVDASAAAGWAGADWQSYDWNGIAHLATPPIARPAVNAELAGSGGWPDAGSVSTRLLGDTLSVTSAGSSSAEEVARALDDIARRIRSGELTIDQFRSSPPEAAMAAALAAMLRLRG